MNWLDYVFILVLAWTAFDGFNRGLIAVSLRFVGTLLALVVAVRYAGMVADFVDSVLGVRAQLTEWLSSSLSVTVDTTVQFPGALPEPQTGAFSEFVSGLTRQAAESVVSPALVSQITDLIVLIASVILTFLIARFVVLIVERLLDRTVVSITGTSGNRLLGMLAGCAQAAIGICLWVLAMYTATLLPTFAPAATWVEGSTIAAYALRAIELAWPWLSRTLA